MKYIITWKTVCPIFLGHSCAGSERGGHYVLFCEFPVVQDLNVEDVLDSLLEARILEHETYERKDASL